MSTCIESVVWICGQNFFFLKIKKQIFLSPKIFKAQFLFVNQINMKNIKIFITALSGKILPHRITQVAMGYICLYVK